MNGINKVTIIGTVGSEPDVRYSNTGNAIARISVATTEAWKDKQTGEKKESTEWHKVVAFGKIAEIINQYVKTGSKIYIEGKNKTRKWQDKDGNTKYMTEVVLSGGNAVLQMLDSKKKDANAQKITEQKQHTNKNKPQEFDDFVDDEIPF